MNNLISPTTISQNDEKPHTAELDDTAMPHVKIKITEIPHEKKPNTAIRNEISTSLIKLLHEKFLQFDWLRAVIFQLNLKYLHVKITNLLRVVV